MSEELLTQQATEESAPAPEVVDGPSEVEGLPEEYKPYSMLPWEEIPEEVREKVLVGVKKFHGGMTRQQQEFAKMKQEFAEAKRNSELLQNMVKEPWLIEAWERHQKGQSAPPPVEEKPVNLAEHLEPETAKAIETIIERALEKRLAPVSTQLSNLSQEQANSKAKADLSEIAKRASDEGMPSPYDYLDKMGQIVAGGRAKSVEDAYRLAIFEDVPKVVETRTRENFKNQISKKAENSVAPAMGPGTNGKVQHYSGRDAVLKAFTDAKRELHIQEI